jgi:predicted Zn-dependent protease with MMP-like domain
MFAMASSEEVFDAIVQRAFEELPTEYREACKDLTIRIERLAASAIMSTLQLASPYQLLGLYHGINLAKKSTFDVQILPNEVIIYREAIVAYAAARGYALQDVVRHVLIHEIGHHFGFSDADMEAIERQA